MAILIQARMSSSRLPGKMLREVAGITLLERVVQRVRHASEMLHLPVSVLTSVEQSDDELYNACKSVGVECFRGPLDDVALRFVEYQSENPNSFFVRVNGDSPMIDPALIVEGVNLFRSHEGIEVVSNVFPRTFPKGQSVEVFCAKAFCEYYSEMNRFQREHIGQYFYQERPSGVLNFESNTVTEKKFADMTIDSQEDLERLSSFLEASEGAAIDQEGWKGMHERLGRFQRVASE